MHYRLLDYDINTHLATYVWQFHVISIALLGTYLEAPHTTRLKLK